MKIRAHSENISFVWSGGPQAVRPGQAACPELVPASFSHRRYPAPLSGGGGVGMSAAVRDKVGPRLAAYRSAILFERFARQPLTFGVGSVPAPGSSPASVNRPDRSDLRCDLCQIEAAVLRRCLACKLSHCEGCWGGPWTAVLCWVCGNHHG
jgi:hypothetical protein